MKAMMSRYSDIESMAQSLPDNITRQDQPPDMIFWAFQSATLNFAIRKEDTIATSHGRYTRKHEYRHLKKNHGLRSV